MRMRARAIACAALLLNACVQAPVFKSEEHALLKSSYPVVKLNGVTIQPSYKLDISAGDTTATTTAFLRGTRNREPLMRSPTRRTNTL